MSLSLLGERAEPGMVTALVVDERGAHAYAAHGSAVSCWSTRHATLSFTQQHDCTVTCLVLHAGALWCGDVRGGIVCCSPATAGICMRRLRGHGAAVKSLHPGATANSMFSLSEDRSVRGWRCSDGQQLLLLRSETYTVTCVTVTRSFLATAEGAFVAVYGAGTGARTQYLQHSGGVVWALLAHNDVLFSGCDSGAVTAFDVCTGACLRVMRGHRRAVTLLACGATLTLFSASGGSGGGMVRAWNVETGECLLIIAVPSSPRTLMAHNGLLFVGCADGRVRQFSAVDGRLMRELGSRHREDVHLMQLSAARGLLFSGSYDGVVQACMVCPPTHWTRENHYLFPPLFRAAARAFLCCVAQPGCVAHALALDEPTRAGLVDCVMFGLAALWVEEQGAACY